MAVALNIGNADLFITVTGSENIHEVRRLAEHRKITNMKELTNRLFQIKLKSILRDIIQGQIFGRVVGRVWVIEYQKR